ncbi:hypothetical protein MVEN_02260000 [Mycena venus]|uniref:DUF7029 domain-containing protein n=1 Tax=Mycena venus TaxID=2733690 RepID=A0A8H7CEW9_9AGAR|nr:hypothetical protein MVEN_02260000 [Mycena venus]
MHLASVVVSFLFLLSLASAHRPKYRTTGRRNERPQVLHPTVHPELDVFDLTLLKPTSGIKMHYHDPHASFPSIRTFASVEVSSFYYPAVLLEHSGYVSSTTCDPDGETITIQFTRRGAWRTALQAWTKHSKFLLLAFADSCGAGRESGERSVHLVHNVTSNWNRMEIVCQMTEMGLREAIHPEREIDIIAYNIAGVLPGHAPHSNHPSDGIRQREDSKSTYDNETSSDDTVTAPNATLTAEEMKKSYDAMFDAEMKIDDSIGYFEDLSDGISDDSQLPDYEIEQLFPSATNETIVVYFHRRGSCRFSLNPFRMLFNCIILPIAKALLPGPVYKALDIFDSIAGFFDLFNQFKAGVEVAKVLTQVLSEAGYTPSGDITFDTNTSLVPLKNIPDFGWSYPIIESSLGGIKSTDPKNGMSLLGQINGFVKAEIAIVKGQFDVGVGAGIIIGAGTLGDKQIIETGLPGLSIPGIFTVGPYITLSASISYDVSITGKFVARTATGWSNITANLDLVNGNKSFIGNWVKRPPVQLIAADITGRASIGPSISVALNFGVNVFGGVQKISISLSIETSLQVGLSLPNLGDIVGSDCPGLKPTLDAVVGLYLRGGAGSASFVVPLFELPLPIYSTCITLARAKIMIRLQIDQPPPIIEPMGNGTKYRTITAHTNKGDLHLYYGAQPNPSLFLLQNGSEIDTTSANRLFVSGVDFDRFTNATAGTYDGRVIIAHSEELDFFKASRVSVASEHSLPKDALVLILRHEIDTTSGKGYLAAVDTKAGEGLNQQRYYRPFVCNFVNKTLPSKLFIGKKDFKPHENPRAPTLEGGLFRSGIMHPETLDKCEYVRFTIS